MKHGGQLPSLSTSDPGKATVDVCVPTLGGSRYLIDAIESVFAQTLTSWRLAISENGMASDEMRRILAPYLEDRRVHHRIVGKTITMPANWTRAIQDGSAPYVAMLHDDDRWDPNFLLSRVQFMESNAHCGFAFAGFRIINETGDVKSLVRHDLPPGINRSATILPLLYERCFVAPPTALVRREAYEAVGAHFKEIFLTDHEMWIRLAAQFDVGFLPLCDSEYRFHSTHNTTKNRARVGHGLLEVINATDHLPIPTLVRRRTRANAHLLCAIDSLELGGRRESLRHLRSAIHTRPLLLVGPGSAARILLVIVALMLGERGRMVFAELRERRFLRRTRAKGTEEDFITR